MRLDHMTEPGSSQLCSEHPLTPIEDADAYRAAIEILDRLFALDDRRTPAELQYFQRLARLASEYEMNRGAQILPL
jgi:hypothetical protein